MEVADGVQHLPEQGACKRLVEAAAAVLPGGVDQACVQFPTMTLLEHNVKNMRLLEALVHPDDVWVLQRRQHDSLSLKRCNSLHIQGGCAGSRHLLICRRYQLKDLDSHPAAIAILVVAASGGSNPTRSISLATLTAAVAAAASGAVGERGEAWLLALRERPPGLGVDGSEMRLVDVAKGALAELPADLVVVLEPVLIVWVQQSTSREGAFGKNLRPGVRRDHLLRTEIPRANQAAVAVLRAETALLHDRLPPPPNVRVHNAAAAAAPAGLRPWGLRRGRGRDGAPRGGGRPSRRQAPVGTWRIALRWGIGGAGLCGPGQTPTAARGVC
mmetsp:Transcript_96954/g.260747  ORF Transcript_96954/g.260747 Transcript_96954/m.260747 type:complete len:329 (-) Transcript_96954:1156-2142(-)